jgi:hypothetical protein
LSILKKLREILKVAKISWRSVYLAIGRVLGILVGMYKKTIAVELADKITTTAIKLDERKSKQIDELIRQLKKIGLSKEEIQKRVLEKLDYDLSAIEQINHVIYRLDCEEQPNARLIDGDEGSL